MSAQDLLNKPQIESLKELAGDDEPDLLKTLFEIFETQSCEILEDLSDAIKAQDADQGYKLAHKFKGSSGNIGAKNLFERTHELELAWKKSGFDGSEQKTLQDLKSLYEESLEALRVELDL